MVKVKIPQSVPGQSMRFRNAFYTKGGIGNQTIACKWPKKRGVAQEGWDLFRQGEFTLAAAWSANSEPLQMETARQWCKGTPYLPRDIIMSAMYGNLFDIVMEDGRVFTSYRRAVVPPLKYLDDIYSTPGGLLVRSDIGWVGLPIGGANYVLCSNGQMPLWLPASQVGLQGPIGPVGPEGPPGTNGTNGTDGAPGPANTLTVGTVTSGPTPTVTITGAAPNQTIDFQLEQGPQGDPGPTGPSGPAGATGGGIVTNYFRALNIFATCALTSSPGIANLTVAPDLIYMWPISFQQPQTLSQCCLLTGTGSATAQGRVAVYEILADGGPGNVLADSGPFSITVNTVHLPAITGTLPAGTYYGAYFQNVSEIVEAWTGASCVTTMGLQQAGANFFGAKGLTFAHTFGSWPNLTGVTATSILNQSAGLPAVGIR